MAEFNNGCIVETSKLVVELSGGPDMATCNKAFMHDGRDVVHYEIMASIYGDDGKTYFVKPCGLGGGMPHMEMTIDGIKRMSSDNSAYIAVGTLMLDATVTAENARRAGLDRLESVWNDDLSFLHRGAYVALYYDSNRGHGEVYFVEAGSGRARKFELSLSDKHNIPQHDAPAVMADEKILVYDPVKRGLVWFDPKNMLFEGDNVEPDGEGDGNTEEAEDEQNAGGEEGEEYEDETVEHDDEEGDNEHNDVEGQESEDEQGDDLNKLNVRRAGRR